MYQYQKYVLGFVLKMKSNQKIFVIHLAKNIQNYSAQTVTFGLRLVQIQDFNFLVEIKFFVRLK